MDGALYYIYSVVDSYLTFCVCLDHSPKGSAVGVKGLRVRDVGGVAPLPLSPTGVPVPVAFPLNFFFVLPQGQTPFNFVLTLRSETVKELLKLRLAVVRVDSLCTFVLVNGGRLNFLD